MKKIEKKKFEKKKKLKNSEKNNIVDLSKINNSSNDKVVWKPGTMLYPLPVVMVSCGEFGVKQNIITVAWTGIINTNPPIVSISIRPERFSYTLIKEAGEFVINLTTKELAFQTDWCGVKSGREFDKFNEMKLTAIKGSKINTPMIAESPVNLECKLLKIEEFQSHHMFVAEIVAVNATKRYLDNKTDSLDLAKSNPLVYCHGKYYELGKFIGKFGFSVEKRVKKY